MRPLRTITAGLLAAFLAHSSSVASELDFIKGLPKSTLFAPRAQPAAVQEPKPVQEKLITRFIFDPKTKTFIQESNFERITGKNSDLSSRIRKLDLEKKKGSPFGVMAGNVILGTGVYLAAGGKKEGAWLGILGVPIIVRNAYGLIKNESLGDRVNKANELIAAYENKNGHELRLAVKEAEEMHIQNKKISAGPSRKFYAANISEEHAARMEQVLWVLSAIRTPYNSRDTGTKIEMYGRDVYHLKRRRLGNTVILEKYGSRGKPRGVSRDNGEVESIINRHLSDVELGKEIYDLEKETSRLIKQAKAEVQAARKQEAKFGQLAELYESQRKGMINGNEIDDKILTLWGAFESGYLDGDYARFEKLYRAGMKEFRVANSN